MGCEGGVRRRYTTELEAAEARESEQHAYYQECCSEYSGWRRVERVTCRRVDELTTALLEERDKQSTELEAVLLDYDVGTLPLLDGRRCAMSTSCRLPRPTASAPPWMGASAGRWARRGSANGCWRRR